MKRRFFFPFLLFLFAPVEVNSTCGEGVPPILGPQSPSGVNSTERANNGTSQEPAVPSPLFPSKYAPLLMAATPLLPIFETFKNEISFLWEGAIFSLADTANLSYLPFIEEVLPIIVEKMMPRLLSQGMIDAKVADLGKVLPILKEVLFEFDFVKNDPRLCTLISTIVDFVSICLLKNEERDKFCEEIGKAKEEELDSSLKRLLNLYSGSSQKEKKESSPSYILSRICYGFIVALAAKNIGDPRVASEQQLAYARALLSPSLYSALSGNSVPFANTDTSVFQFTKDFLFKYFNYDEYKDKSLLSVLPIIFGLKDKLAGLPNLTWKEISKKIIDFSKELSKEFTTFSAKDSSACGGEIDQRAKLLVEGINKSREEFKKNAGPFSLICDTNGKAAFAIFLSHFLLRAFIPWYRYTPDKDSSTQETPSSFNKKPYEVGACSLSKGVIPLPPSSTPEQSFFQYLSLKLDDSGQAAEAFKKAFDASASWLNLFDCPFEEEVKKWVSENNDFGYLEFLLQGCFPIWIEKKVKLDIEALPPENRETRKKELEAWGEGAMTRLKGGVITARDGTKVKVRGFANVVRDLFSWQAYTKNEEYKKKWLCFLEDCACNIMGFEPFYNHHEIRTSEELKERISFFMEDFFKDPEATFWMGCKKNTVDILRFFQFLRKEAKSDFVEEFIGGLVPPGDDLEPEEADEEEALNTTSCIPVLLISFLTEDADKKYTDWEEQKNIFALISEMFHHKDTEPYGALLKSVTSLLSVDTPLPAYFHYLRACDRAFPKGNHLLRKLLPLLHMWPDIKGVFQDPGKKDSSHSYHLLYILNLLKDRSDGCLFTHPLSKKCTVFESIVKFFASEDDEDDKKPSRPISEEFTDFVKVLRNIYTQWYVKKINAGSAKENIKRTSVCVFYPNDTFLIKDSFNGKILSKLIEESRKNSSFDQGSVKAILKKHNIDTIIYDKKQFLVDKEKWSNLYFLYKKIAYYSYISPESSPLISFLTWLKDVCSYLHHSSYLEFVYWLYSFEYFDKDGYEQFAHKELLSPVQAQIALCAQLYTDRLEEIQKYKKQGKNVACLIENAKAHFIQDCIRFHSERAKRVLLEQLFLLEEKIKEIAKGEKTLTELKAVFAKVNTFHYALPNSHIEEEASFLNIQTQLKTAESSLHRGEEIDISTVRPLLSYAKLLAFQNEEEGAEIKFSAEKIEKEQLASKANKENEEEEEDPKTPPLTQKQIDMILKDIEIALNLVEKARHEFIEKGTSLEALFKRLNKLIENFSAEDEKQKWKELQDACFKTIIEYRNEIGKIGDLQKADKQLGEFVSVAERKTIPLLDNDACSEQEINEVKNFLSKHMSFSYSVEQKEKLAASLKEELPLGESFHKNFPISLPKYLTTKTEISEKEIKAIEGRQTIFTCKLPIYIPEYFRDPNDHESIEIPLAFFHEDIVPIFKDAGLCVIENEVIQNIVSKTSHQLSQLVCERAASFIAALSNSMKIAKGIKPSGFLGKFLQQSPPDPLETLCATTHKALSPFFVRSDLMKEVIFTWATGAALEEASQMISPSKSLLQKLIDGSLFPVKKYAHLCYSIRDQYDYCPAPIWPLAKILFSIGKGIFAFKNKNLKANHTGVLRLLRTIALPLMASMARLLVDGKGDFAKSAAVRSFFSAIFVYSGFHVIDQHLLSLWTSHLSSCENKKKLLSSLKSYLTAQQLGKEKEKLSIQEEVRKVIEEAFSSVTPFSVPSILYSW